MPAPTPNKGEPAGWSDYADSDDAPCRPQRVVKSLICFSVPVKAPGMDFRIGSNSLG